MILVLIGLKNCSELNIGVKKQFQKWEYNLWWLSFTVMGRKGKKLR